MSDLIKQTRLTISNIGGSELKAVANNENLQKLFKQKQELIAEMNQEVDKTYAFLLVFLGDNKNKE